MIMLSNQLAVILQHIRVAPAQRSHPEPRTLAKYNRDLRTLKKRAGLCVNGRKDGLPGRDGVAHGPPITPSGKCQQCVEIHRKSR